MTNEELVALLSDNITYNLRHAGYYRAMEVKKMCRMVVFGEGEDYEAEVTRYKRGEDDDMKDQRVRLTNAPTPALLSRLRKFWKQMARIEQIRRTFKLANESEADKKKLATLRTQFYNFVPGEAIEQWQNKVVEHLGVTDPNAWIVYDRYDRRNVEGIQTETRVYPLIFGCEDTLNFGKSYGVLDWILFRNASIKRVGNPHAPTDLAQEDFYLYSVGKIVRAREIVEEAVKGAGGKIEQEEGEVLLSIPGALQSKARNFWVKIIENGSKEVLAECVGVYFDESLSDYSTFVTWFWAGIFTLKDLIRAKSTSDVLQTIYANPRTTRFTKACKFTHTDFGQCVNGYYSGIRQSDHLCSSCQGTGRMAGFTSEQQIIELVLPDLPPNEIIELARLSYTEPVDIQLLVWYDGKIKELEDRFMSTVFPSGLYQNTNGTEVMTATQTNAIMQGISDVLAPFGAVDSRHFEMAYRAGAQYMGFELDVDKSYPEDLMIQLKAQVVADFVAIKESGVGYEAVKAQQWVVFQKLFEGNPIVQESIKARYKWKPWDDKSDDQVAQIISGLSPTDPTLVLWTYHLTIFDEIEYEDPNFYKKNRKAQKEKVDAKVLEFTQRIQVMQIDTQATTPNFNAPAVPPIDNNPTPNANPQ